MQIKNMQKYGMSILSSSVSLVEGNHYPFYSATVLAHRVSQDIMQQTDKVNGMQAVKFVELTKGYTRNVHIRRDGEGDR